MFVVRSGCDEPGRRLGVGRRSREGAHERGTLFHVADLSRIGICLQGMRVCCRAEGVRVKPAEVAAQKVWAITCVVMAR